MRRLLGSVAALCMVLGAAGTSGAGQISAVSILVDLHFKMGEIVSVEEGHIITSDLPRQRDNELAAVAAAMVPASLRDVEAALLAMPSDETETKTFSVPVDEDEWRSMKLFTAREREDLAHFKEAALGPDVNLSADEVALMHNGSPAAAGYREVLVNRVKAYASKGAKGLAPYSRDAEPASSPADELRMASEQSAALLARYLPDVARALKNYPDAGLALDQRFTWSKPTVDGHPTHVLAHEIVDRDETHCVLVHQEFFVGRTYNTQHAVTLAVPATDGTLVIGLNRTFTDRVAGPFNGFQRDVGQKMMREALAEKLEDLRKKLTH